MKTPTSTTCARHLPQHFNGCACVSVETPEAIDIVLDDCTVDGAVDELFASIASTADDDTVLDDFEFTLD